MVEITTLLLGLVVGPRTIDVVAAPEVASVVLQLDGEVAVGVVPEDGAGSAEVSFGTLLPHRLTAVAYDAAGREVGRDDEWINLPRPTIAGELALHGDPSSPRSATLHWQSVERQPVAVRAIAATLDGEPLPAAAGAAIALPEAEPGTPHLLVVEVTFSNGERLELARSFGGGAVDEVATRLLPVWMELRDGAAWPEHPAGVAPCLAAPAGVRVHGWEEEAAEVLVVRDMNARAGIERLVRNGVERSRRRLGLSIGDDDLLPLREGDRLRQVWPIPDQVEQEGRVLTLFPSTAPERAEGRSLISILREWMRPRRGDQELPGAVAVAGLLAYGSRRPGAVVLITGGPPEDAAEADARWPAAVRGFLAALGVPFEVWDVTGSAAASPWGPAVDVSTFERLAQAVADLRTDLDRQRLVWLAGADLPQQVRFAECGCCAPTAARLE